MLQDDLARLAKTADRYGQADDALALQIWEEHGISSLGPLLAQPLALGKAEQTIGLELADDERWPIARPLLAEALARGGPRLVLRLLCYLDGDRNAEVLVHCGSPSTAFAEDDLAAWCRVLGAAAHPETLAMLARLRHHRARRVQLAAAIHDPAHGTAARAIELVDGFPDDAPFAHIAILGERDAAMLADADLQAAIVRLLDRRRDVLSAAFTAAFHEALAMRAPSPALAAWFATARDDAALHPAFAEVVARHGAPLEIARWLADHAAPESARRAREALARAGALTGRFLDVSGTDATLVPDELPLSIAEIAAPHDTAHVSASIEVAFASPPRLGVTFDHAGTTWCAVLRIAGDAGGYHPTYAWTEIAKLTEATDALAIVAAMRRAREAAATAPSTEALVAAARDVRSPAPLVPAVDRLCELAAFDEAIELGLRLHAVIDSYQELVRPHVHANALAAAQVQLFRVLMAAQRYTDAATVGAVIGPLPHARALIAAGRHAEALDALAPVAKTPEGIPLERACRAALAAARTGFAVGAQVRHAKFGEGVVLAATGEGAAQKLRIRFPGGERTLAASFVTR
jgi:hypothetical protein